jgi:hypothetical protein
MKTGRAKVPQKSAQNAAGEWSTWANAARSCKNIGAPTQHPVIARAVAQSTPCEGVWHKMDAATLAQHDGDL